MPPKSKASKRKSEPETKEKTDDKKSKVEESTEWYLPLLEGGGGVMQPSRNQCVNGT